MRFIGKEYFLKGQLFQQNKKTDTAIYFFRKALECFEKTSDKESMAAIYCKLADIANASGNYSKTLLLLKSAKTLYRQLNYLQSEYDISGYIVYIHLISGNADSAIMHLNENLEYHKRLSADYFEVLDYLSLAYIYHRVKNIPNKAFEYYFNAQNLADSIKNDKLLIDIYKKIGVFFLEQKSNFPIAREFYTKALEITDRNDTAMIAELYGKIGSTYFLEENDSIAFDYYHNGIELAKKTNRKELLVSLYNGLGLGFLVIWEGINDLNISTGNRGKNR